MARSPADVTVTGGDSSLNIQTPRGELSFALPAGVTYEQGSCIPTPAGESCGDELHFRLRIRVGKNTGEGNVQDEARPPSASLVSSVPRLKQKSFGSYLMPAVYLIGLSHSVI